MFTLAEGHAEPVLKAPNFGLASASSNSLPELTLNSSNDTAGSTLDLRALTLAIRRGDAPAFSRFYDLYSFRLYRFLLVLARGDEYEAQEICQAVFIKLAKRLAVFDDEHALWAWLCTVAKNAFIDHYRTRQRQNRLVALEKLSPVLEAEANTTNWLAELLCDALAALSPDERELIQAAYVDERPLKELADASGQTYKAIESRLARLRYKLKEQLLKHLRHEPES
jgi:RNA polymerase sigma-70 factor (ECF subfamily)